MNRYYRISLYCILSYTKLNSIADDLLHTPVVCMQGFSHRHVGLQFNANAHQLDRCKVLDSGDVQPENLILKVDQIRCLFLLVVTCKCLYWDLQLYKIFVLIKNIYFLEYTHCAQQSRAEIIYQAFPSKTFHGLKDSWTYCVSELSLLLNIATQSNQWVTVH